VYVKKDIVAPTCENTGIQAYVCEICEKQQHETTIAALGHSWKRSKNIAPNSCTMDGIDEYKCQFCNKTKEETVPKHGHSWPYIEEHISSSTNEIVFCGLCRNCDMSSTEYRVKIDDVEKLVKLSFAQIYGDANFADDIQPPYYFVLISDEFNFIMVFRRDGWKFGESFDDYDFIYESVCNNYFDSTQESLRKDMLARGWTVAFEAAYIIHEDGTLVVSE
jgi:hypothetical protein